MHRIGLALSGGGFRATLFHLGMIRFLREANILPAVTHITSVSGGSILAAHLVLNWQRYNGSLEEFDAAAAELIRFVQLDVRNRVVRRYPLAMPLRALRRLTLRRPNRQLTRTGLLEYHYEKFLYGDTCLFQLPERPRLYILATNLSEGCLCAFTRDGLIMQRRRPGHRFHFDRIHTGLATVPMAVTASSAFPGSSRRSNCRGGCRRRPGPVRPARLHRWRRLRQSGRAHVPLDGAVMDGARGPAATRRPCRCRRCRPRPRRRGAITGRHPASPPCTDDGLAAQRQRRLDRPIRRDR